MTSEADTSLINQSSENRRRQWGRKDLYLVAILLLVSCLILLPARDSFGLIDPSDALYPETSREMLERGDFITPYCNYVPMFDKPILIYWSIISCYKMFGVAEWAARVPSAMAAILTVLSLFCLSRFYLRRRAAFLAAMILITSPMFVLLGHLGTTDMLLSCWLTIAMLCLWRRGDGDGMRCWLGAYLALSLAILTKGPLALVLTALIIVGIQSQADWLAPAVWWRQSGRWFTLTAMIASLALTGTIAAALFVTSLLSYVAALKLPARSWWHRCWQLLRRRDQWLGLLILCAVVLPWFVAETIVTHGDFFNAFIIQENFGRLAGTINHQNPFIWFYIPFLLAGFFPWILLLIPGRKTLRSMLRKRNKPGRSQQLAQYACVWAIVVLVLFTLVRTKLPTYILPALPPLAVLVGLILDRWIVAKNYQTMTWFAGSIALLSWLGCCVLGYFVGTHSAWLANAAVAVTMAIGAALLTALSSWAFWAAHSKRVALSLYALLAGYACFVACYMPAALIINDELNQRPFRSLVIAAGRGKGSLSTFLRDSHSAVYYYKHTKVPLLLNEQQYENFLRTEPAPHFTLTPINLLPALQARIPNVRVVASTSKWALCSLDAEHK